MLQIRRQFIAHLLRLDDDRLQACVQNTLETRLLVHAEPHHVFRLRILEAEQAHTDGHSGRQWEDDAILHLRNAAHVDEVE